MKSKEQIEQTIKDLENHRQYVMRSIDDLIRLYVEDEERFTIGRIADFVKRLIEHASVLYRIENEIILLKWILKE